MLIADADVQTAWNALIVAVLLGLAGIVAAVGRAIARRIEATDTRKQTEEVLHVARQTYQSFNGSGLTGTIQRVERKLDVAVGELKECRDDLKAHGEDDRRQFGDIRAYLGMPADDANA